MDQEQTIPKWARLSGDELSAVRTRCVELYTSDALSIREIVERTGRSYGWVHRVLVEAHVQMRPRGNPMRS